MTDEINIDEIKEHMAALLEDQLETKEELLEVRREVAEIEKKFQAITNQRLELERKQAALNTEIREAEKKLATANRLKLLEEEQERLRKEFEEKSKRLDELTAQAFWREFAFEHQIEGAKKLAIAHRGILADKRGLGKTLSSLIYLDMIQARKVIVIAPNDVVTQFQEEINHWTQRTIMPLSGMPKAQRDVVYPMLNQLDEFIITLNYEAWRRDKTIIDDLVGVGLDTVICDEAHRAKSWQKVTARGIFQLIYRPNYCPSCDKVDNFMGSWSTAKGLQDKYAGDVGEFWAPTCPNCGAVLQATVKNVLPMTGTPFLNKPQELFSLLHMVDRVKFPNEKAFLRDYCYPSGPNRWRFKTGGLDRLTNTMKEFFLSRTRDDTGIKVPPPAITVHEIVKDPVKYAKQYKAEQDISQFGAMYFNEEQERKDIFFLLELILRERQCMTWPAGIRITDPETKELICHFDVRESQKIDEAMDLLGELLEEGERVVIFSQFVDPLREMHNRLREAGEYQTTMATGQESKFHRDQVREDFDLKTADPHNYKWQAVFATYKALGTGVNLNAARHMILLDDEWNPGMEDQAIGRIDRLNSVDQANVHIFRVKDSIDDFMAGLLDEKRQLTQDFESAPAFQLLSEFFKDRG